MKLRTICQIYSTSPIWPESKHSMCFDSGLAAINCDVPQDFFYFYYIWMTLIKHIANKISLNVKKTEMVIFKSVLGKITPWKIPPLPENCPTPRKISTQKISPRKIARQENYPPENCCLWNFFLWIFVR